MQRFVILTSYLTHFTSCELNHHSVPDFQFVAKRKVSRSFSSTEVKQFGSLVKDLNFLHESVPWSDDIEIMQESFPLSQAHISEGLVIPESQTNATMTRPLVHGIFLSSMFSSIFAGIAPGCVYINQTLQFASPVFVDETVTSRVTIEKLRRWPKGGIVVQCDTRVQKVDDETVAVTGTANVWLPKGHRKAN